MKARTSIIITATIAIMAVSACSGYKERTLDYLGKRPTTGAFFKEDTTPMVDLNYKAANEISNQLEARLPPGSPITVTMFRMRGSTMQTDFAKVLTEQVASKIAQEGFAIVADSSRFPMAALDEDLAPPEKCVLAGAYSVGPEIISITAAVSTVTDGEILGSYDWNVPLNSKTRALLPIKESPFIEPLVNTSGPIEKTESSSGSFQPSNISGRQNSAPVFEQDILE
ncbi:hypothetical protein [Maridesulfovibrio hydrothermalis]|uniref:FlgO domain-containing protein n=1 Tax=Maridesulfovibrio hydrothermalis AM13 = DSM 14728 TaxID=1121451 RepID=L0R634_9BACT|nr:hypothetical protein [Maridesulfovibrio hydrothermalis]CCO22153.1 conserved exported protein of unknown function [Maridesulfovibrio hydrothermalis AM13 = DSM 14728]